MVRFAPILFFIIVLACNRHAEHPAAVSEPHRPKFHFSPPKMWMNDPNGMVYYEGEYHLFYQYHPDSTVWGPMHWGHAVSKDLMHWEHLPIALYPDSLGMIFSGSAVVDWKNTSGFGLNDKPPLVAIFTHHLMEGEKAGRDDYQYQSIAYSNDNGHTWTKYKNNPVVPNTFHLKDFRDPKVRWDEFYQQWIMTLAAYDHIKFWSSPNLKNWKHLSDFGKDWGGHGGVWECPDFFPMKVEGTNAYKWVLIQNLNPGAPNSGSGTQYFIGDFDGNQFKLDSQFMKDVTNGKGIWLDWGRDNYAGVTWSDIPKEDGRNIFMGWMSNWDYGQVVPTSPWRSAMTIPRVLTLHNTDQGLRLFTQPAREIESLYQKEFVITNQELKKEYNLMDHFLVRPLCIDMVLEIDLGENPNSNFAVSLSNSRGEEYKVGYDRSKNEFYSDRTRSGDISFSEKFASKIHTTPRTTSASILQLRIIFDVASCEMFADDGATVMTEIFFPTEDYTTLKIISSDGKAIIKSGTFHQVQAAW